MNQILSRTLLCLFFAAAGSAAIAQPQQPAAAPTAQAPVPPPSGKQKETTVPSAPLRFDLDFKGGSIRALFDAIGAARGKPVNVYLPREAESISVAPFRVSGVTVTEILDAVSSSGGSQIYGNAKERLFHYSLTSAAESSPDSAVWTVKVEDFSTPTESVCHVYSLSPYLESNLSVDDITTAIRTAWKMLNYTPSTVNLSYHRETKLLIAVAPEEELKAVEQVLAALPKGSSSKKGAALAPTEAPKAPAAKL